MVLSDISYLIVLTSGFSKILKSNDQYFINFKHQTDDTTVYTDSRDNIEFPYI